MNKHIINSLQRCCMQMNTFRGWPNAKTLVNQTKRFNSEVKNAQQAPPPPQKMDLGSRIFFGTLDLIFIGGLGKQLLILQDLEVILHILDIRATEASFSIKKQLLQF
jgi:hypothetical protein